jgi:hypothetical protein
MKISSLGCLLLVTNLAFAVEQPKYDAFASIKPTTLTNPTRAKDSPVSVMNFRGELTISGRFTVAWATNQPDNLLMYFYPDVPSQEQLPYFTGGQRAQAEAVQEISVWHQKKTLVDLLSQDQYARLMSREIREISGEATVVISNYTSGVDCDRRWYVAQIKKVKQSEALQLAAITNKIASC